MVTSFLQVLLLLLLQLLLRLRLLLRSQTRNANQQVFAAFGQCQGCLAGGGVFNHIPAQANSLLMVGGV